VKLEREISAVSAQSNQDDTHVHQEERSKMLKMLDHERERYMGEDLDQGEDESGDNITDDVVKDSSTGPGDDQAAVGEEDDDIDDMFADTPEDKKKDGAAGGKKITAGGEKKKKQAVLLNRADEEGYYRPNIGEIFNGRYQVIAKCGSGVFSNVVKVIDIQTTNEYAVKIIRNHEVMRRSGESEIQILKKLNELDKQDKRHCIRLIDHFDMKDHLCLVFESFDMNLRDAVKKFGSDGGLSLMAVRSYAKQLFLGLSLLRKARIMHADIKPDNILVSRNTKTVKICDFGSASPVEENTITEYLVSRYYRAPEITLGAPYDFAIDTWSIGCTLYEAATGKILFPGRINNQMLKYFMQTRGKFSGKVLKRGEYSSRHFNEHGHFLSVEYDKATNKNYIKTYQTVQVVRDLGVLIKAAKPTMSLEEQKIFPYFKDFLEKCLMLDPQRRFTPEDALSHAFLSVKSNK